MKGSKTQKIFLEAGEYLGKAEGGLVVRNNKKKQVEMFPLFENKTSEVEAKIGASISTAALASCAFWQIGVLIKTQRGNPVCYLWSIQDDSHVKTRIGQYEALKDGRGVQVAKKIVLGKAQGQNELLKKYGLRMHDLIKIKASIESIETTNLQSARKKLMSIEGKYTEFYFRQIFPLFPQAILKTDGRRTFKAYDGVNNTFNLGYEILRWRTLSAIIKSKLEPFLGFLHSQEFSKPSLVCDLMECYRFLVDDFIIQFMKDLREKDFILQEENFSSNKKGKRVYLNKDLAKDLMKKLFESW